ncbi:MAG: hypothetical protein KJ905_03200 [Nanoarchaeota archaeon]|nr:hypothetical protein [Nanoarchaeota archaeon]MBU1501755.1 hypothetical protein [Nanoarchaeota archaeon]
MEKILQNYRMNPEPYFVNRALVDKTFRPIDPNVLERITVEDRRLVVLREPYSGNR